MASEASVRSDGSLLSRVDQGLFRVELGLALVGGLAVMSLMALAVVSVGGRNFFNRPLDGYVDWIEQLMPAIAFLGVAYTQRLGGHIRMDLFVSRLRGRALWLFECVTTLGMLLLGAVMIHGSWSHFLRSFDFAAPNWSRDSSMDIALPLWPAKLLVPVALSVLCARLLIQLIAYARALRNGEREPVAVPLIEDAATQAAREAQSVEGEGR